ncbi:MAG TPA: DUF3488 and transglutaminase-like domain-containing protein [Phycisphaerae bacterium]|nr:DUF3488 and transglutaminase-like domain-containing protein [Phycisphaerae bacterium]
MKHLGRMHLSLILLALVNMLPAVEVEDSWGILGIAVCSAIGSILWFLWRRGAAPSRWLVYCGVTAATVYLVYEMFFPQEEQTVHIVDLSHFIILLCCCKFFDFQSYRDAGLIAIISFLLMVISAFVTASPLFAVAAFVDVTFGLAWLLHFHTQREAFAVARRQSRVNREIERAGTAIPTDQPRAGTKRTVLACSILLVGFSSLVFIFAPRGWRGGLFGRMQSLVPASVTGFSDSVELTDNPVIPDETTVMRVRFTTHGETVTDESFQAYMRGATFDQYFRGRWQHGQVIYPRVINDARMEAPLPIIDLFDALPEEQQIRQEIWLESLGNGALFSLFPPLKVGSSDIGRLNVNRRDLTLSASTTSRKAAHYTVWSGPDSLFKQAHAMHRRPPRREIQSIIPPRIAELAESLLPPGTQASDGADRGRISAAIRNYLASDRFEYTLDRGSSRADADPVVDFLFESQRGYCEHFASAMTLMCQSLGFPTRMVTGFQGGEINEVGGFFQFRRKDAHAWVEVWLPESGWTLFDPTPASAAETRRGQPSLWSGLVRLVDYLRFSWSTSIVSFDERNREELAKGLSAWFFGLFKGRGEPKSLGEVVTEVLRGPEFFEWWQRFLYWVLLALCVALAVLAVRVLWILSLMLREYLPARRRSTRAFVRPAEARFYDRMILLLANKGHLRPPQATPREFAERLSRAHHDLGEMPELVEWFYEAQYGARPLGRDRWQRVKRFLQRLREDPSFGAA